MAIDTLMEIFETLKELGFCKDQRDFSVDWLGRSEGYLAYLKASGARPNLASLGMLVGLIHAVVPPASDSRNYVSRRRLRGAWVAALTMLNGEREIQLVPRRFWVTAVGPNPATSLPSG